MPDPEFPFLGVHFTKRIRFEAGPDGLALSREGYRKSDVNIGDTVEMFAFPGFWIMGLRYWRMGFNAPRSSQPQVLHALEARSLPAG